MCCAQLLLLSLSRFPTTLTSCSLILTTKHCVTKQLTQSPASSIPALGQSCQLPFKLGRVSPHICQFAISNASFLLMSACLLSTWMARRTLPRAEESKWWNETQNTFLPIKNLSLEMSWFSYCPSLSFNFKGKLPRNVWYSFLGVVVVVVVNLCYLLDLTKGSLVSYSNSVLYTESFHSSTLNRCFPHLPHHQNHLFGH